MKEASQVQVNLPPQRNRIIFVKKILRIIAKLEIICRCKTGNPFTTHKFSNVSRNLEDGQPNTRHRVTASPYGSDRSQAQRKYEKMPGKSDFLRLKVLNALDGTYRMFRRALNR
eukprot:1335435-Amorphochlora_amoeboformis.AAC.1